MLKLVLPPDFDDYAWEVEAKGYFGSAQLVDDGKCLNVIFYDPVRLQQDIESELAAGKPFFEPNVVVLMSVTKENMQAAVDTLLATAEELR
jgi:hypothetical protein